MKFSYNESNSKNIQKKIIKELGGRELGKMIQIDIDDHDLVVTISKMGTSQLVFSEEDTEKGKKFSLKKEKIAFAHRIFKDEVTEKLCHVIEKTGGTILER